MDLQKHQAPTWGYAQGRPLLAQGWRVFTKFRAFLLWFAGFHLGANLALIAWGAQDGKTAVNMMAPILGCVVAIALVVMAVWTSPNVAEYAGDEN